MKMSDDEMLQDLLEKGLFPGDESLSKEQKKELAAYQQLFEALATEPEQGPSFSFAARVSRAVRQQLIRKSDTRFNMIAAGIFVVSLALVYGFLALFNPSACGLILLVAIKFKWIWAFCILAFLGLQVAEQQLLKRDF